MDSGLSIPDNEKEIFDVMKHEVNGYNSFMGRWPLSIIIDDWNVGETPLKKHMKKALKCPFLMASNVGNIPMQKQKPVEKSLNWPLMMLNPRQLSECGLFYTDNEDIITCFYCGGSPGNWELNDNLWVEHD
ncbi:baculoviral IAP repeat-containing protein 7-A [Caerostris extrusa]|uniref:Baculoviral IAP repeat-containing protein 7-A n=1 Tax=Caerostris extrusa TaxID=172846 RepID=A0AAV4QEQ2_CAEEX|nr:baculoviral IAP repeat-containing protein 7-A [Caerostris extrusa]